MTAAALLLGAAVTVLTALPAAATPAGCDLRVIAAQAAESFPAAAVDVAADQGVVTLRIRAADGSGSFAIALHARGTELASSVMGDGLDADALARRAAPVSTWWQHGAVQNALVACSGGATPPDLAAAARAALQPARPDAASWSGPRTAALVLGSAWIVLALALLAIGAHIAGDRRQRVALLALFAVALLLDAWLCAGGPGDLRLNLAPIWSADEIDRRWGPAPIALFRLVGLGLGELRDVHIRWLNLLLASALPVLLYLIVVELGLSRIAAALAALISAAHPLLIAFSGDLGRQPTYLFAAFGGVLGLLAYLRRGGATALLACALGTGLAIASRPEGAHVLVALWAIAVLQPAATRRRAGAGAALLLLSALAAVYVRYALDYGSALADDTTTPSRLTDPSVLAWTILFDRDFTPLAWIIVWLLGIALGLRRRAAWIALAMLIGFHLAWSATGLYDTFVGYERQVASARYEAILLLPFAIGTALCVEALRAAPRWLQAGGAVALAGLTLVTYPRPAATLLAPFTVDYEYAFLRRHAADLPAGSRIYVLEPPVNDVGFCAASEVGYFIGSGARFESWAPHLRATVPVDPAHTYLYIGSACAPLIDHPSRPFTPDYRHWLGVCAALRAALAGDAVEESDVPAHKMSWNDFRDPTVRLGLYRLTSPPRLPPRE